MGSALREVVTYDVINGRWKETRKFVEIENPENRKIRKVKDDELIPFDESVDVEMWYDISPNKKSILEDAGIVESKKKIPDSQELSPDIRDKVGEDYDYLTDNEKLHKLLSVGFDPRKKFPPDNFSDLNEEEQLKVQKVFEEKKKITTLEQERGAKFTPTDWPVVYVPDVIFDTFLSVVERSEKTAGSRPGSWVAIGHIGRADTQRFEDNARLILKEIGAKDIRFQEKGGKYEWQATLTASLPKPTRSKTNEPSLELIQLYNKLNDKFPSQFVIDELDEERGEIAITSLTGRMVVPVNPIHIDELTNIRNDLMKAWNEETGEKMPVEGWIPKPTVPELPEQDPKTVRGAVVANIETGDRGVVWDSSTDSVIVMLPPGTKREQWPLSKIELIQEAEPRVPYSGRGRPKKR